jgi:hypothetical protein
LLEASRAGVELHSDVRRDHGPQDGDIFFAVHANESEDEWLGLLSRGYGPAKQEGHAAEESSSHFENEVEKVKEINEVKDQNTGIAGRIAAVGFLFLYVLYFLNLLYIRLFSSRWAARVCR